MNSLIALAAAAAFTSSHDLRIDDDEDEDGMEEGSDEGADEAPTPKKKKGSKKLKKGSKILKKGEKSEKSEKSSKSESKDTVRLKDLAKQAKLTEAVCRKKLRDAEVPRGEGRWSWALGSRDLKAARKALGLGN